MHGGRLGAEPLLAFDSADESTRAWARLVGSLGFTEFISAEDGFSKELGSGKAWSNADACGISMLGSRAKAKPTSGRQSGFAVVFASTGRCIERSPTRRS